jgi:two-component sensor histidine kinase
MTSFIPLKSGLAEENRGPRGSPGRRFDGCETCVLLDEADHRIANHLAVLAGYVRLKAADCARQTREPTRDDMVRLLESIGAQIDSVARLHRALAVGHGTTSPDLAVHLRRTCAPFRESFSRSIAVTEDYEPGCVIRPDQVLPLTQVVAEVMTNAMKYAHPDGGMTKVHVSCHSTPGLGPRITITDDGVGLPDNLGAAASDGMGLRLLRGLARQLGATMEFKSTRRGLDFSITLPAPAAA